jgi:hypothetical protein
MWLTPTRRQWNNWTLPSKLGLVGAYLGVVGLLLSVIMHIASEHSSARSEARLTETIEAAVSPEEIAQRLQSAIIAHDSATAASVALSRMEREQLIEIVEFRARTIRQNLHKLYHYAPVAAYLQAFDSLHERHVAALQTNNLILAHEILGKIHELSYELDADEFWRRHKVETPDRLYMLAEDAFQRGNIICMYVGGETRAYCDSYRSDSGFVLTFSRREREWALLGEHPYRLMLAQP